MKKLFFLVAAVVYVSLSSLAQVNQAPTTNDDKWDNKKNAEFAQKAVSRNELQIQLAKLAQQKATSQQVKDLAAWEEKDHSDALKKLQSAYKVAPGIQDDDKEVLESLIEENGQDFEKKYIDKLVDIHQEGLNDMEDAFSKTSDPALKGWISNSLLLVNGHLGKAQKLQKELK